MRSAYIEDFNSVVEFETINLDAIDAIDKYFDYNKVKELVKASDPKSFENLYLVRVCELGLALGALSKLLILTSQFPSISKENSNGLVVNSAV